MRLRRALVLAVVVLSACGRPDPRAWLNQPQAVAPGIEFFSTSDPTLVDPPGPVAVYLLRLDPARVRLASVLSNDAVVGAERVDAIASRHDAIAAINGGFFNVRNGEPVSVLKVSGEIVSDTPATKGVVLIRSPPAGRTRLRFDQASVRLSLSFRAEGRDWSVPIDGVDTTRGRGKLMLYTPMYHGDTDTAANGTEWVLEGAPLTVTDVRHDAGRTPIPKNGVVLSLGSLEPTGALGTLVPGVAVTVTATWRSVNGLSTAEFDEADHVVNGAGLLRIAGQTPGNWESAENLDPVKFLNVRHPRTIIGMDRQGFIWLVAIDGRQIERSLGMSFADLQRLCDRLEFTDALNLDGGGSTTMVVKGTVVNKPSDATGPRPVSDAILVSVR